MTGKPESLFEPLVDDLRSLAGEVRELAAARWQLAALELRDAGRQIVRLAIALVIAIVLVVVVLSVMAVAAADVLATLVGGPLWAWLLGTAGTLLLSAALLAWLAWRRFRRNFAGLEETLEELREDLVWLEEHATQASASRP
jgi:uncharacterized membrane protein YqjE